MTGERPGDDAWALPGVAMPQPPADEAAGAAVRLGGALPPPTGEPVLAMPPAVDETPTTVISAVRVDPADETPTQLIPVQRGAAVGPVLPATVSESVTGAQPTTITPSAQAPDRLAAPKRRRAALISTLAAVAVVGVAAAVITLENGHSAPSSTALASQTHQPGQPRPSGLSDGAVNEVPGIAEANSASSAVTPGDSSDPAPGKTSPPSSRSSVAPAASPAASTSAASAPAAPGLAAALALHWRLADGGGTTAADSGPHGEAGRLAGPVAFGPAHGGSAVFTPPAGKIEGAAISAPQGIDTTKSFTVSEWVYQTTPTTPSKYVSAFSQDGSAYSAFFFTYSIADHKWFFGRSVSATTSSGTDESWAWSTTPLDTWVLLTGVYDASAGTVTLYVDGQAQTVVQTRSAPYAVSGPVVLGRSWYQTYPSNPFAGSLSDFRVYDRVLTAAEVHSLLSAG